MAIPALLKRARSSILGSTTIDTIDRYHQQLQHVQQFWAWKVYTHNYRDLVISTLRYRYTHAWKDIDQYVEPAWNPLRKVANIKAQAYSRPPVRRTDNDALATIIRRSSPRINRALNYAEKLMHATGNACLWPVITVENAEPALDLLVVAPHACYLTENYDDGRYDVVCKYLNWFMISEYTGGARRNYVTDSKGAPVTPFASVGAPVWISLTYAPFGEPRTIAPVSDLLMGTIGIGVMEAFAEKVVFLKSFKQMAEGDASSGRINPDKLIAGPEHMWPAVPDMIDLADKDGLYEQLIEDRAVRLAGQHGISKLMMSGDYRDGSSWISVNEEILKHHEEQIENAHEIERELWRSVCAMPLVDQPADTVVNVSYLPPHPGNRDPRTEWEIFREKVKHGCAQTLEWIQKEHQEFSEEEARKYYDDAIAEYAKEVNMKRELNISDEGNSPKVNGAARFGVLGAEGPSVDNKESEVDLMKEADNE